MGPRNIGVHRRLRNPEMLRTAAIVALLSASLYAQDPAALCEAAQQAVQARRPEEAERLWRQAVSVSPRYFPALFNLGLFYQSRKQFSEAIPLLVLAAEVSPGDFNTHYLLGACYQVLGR